jgi:hypothetical protein
MKKVLFFVFCVLASSGIYAQCPNKIKRGVYILQSDLSKCSPDNAKSLGGSANVGGTIKGDIKVGGSIQISSTTTIQGVCSSATPNINLVWISRRLPDDRLISKYFEYDGNKNCDFRYSNLMTNERKVLNILQIYKGNL